MNGLTVEIRLPVWLRGTNADGSPYAPTSPFAAYASHIGDYMRRWIVQTPWGTLRLHNIRRPDAGTAPHDHAWDFASLILRGGYSEQRYHRDYRTRDGRIHPWASTLEEHRAGNVVQRHAEDLHLITRVEPGTWTLVVTGPKRRSWGFRVFDFSGSRWVPWREFVKRGAA
jgi:hypothetical protein